MRDGERQRRLGQIAQRRGDPLQRPDAADVGDGGGQRDRPAWRGAARRRRARGGPAAAPPRVRSAPRRPPRPGRSRRWRASVADFAHREVGEIGAVAAERAQQRRHRRRSREPRLRAAEFGEALDQALRRAGVVRVRPGCWQAERCPGSSAGKLGVRRLSGQAALGGRLAAALAGHAGDHVGGAGRRCRGRDGVAVVAGAGRPALACQPAGGCGERQWRAYPLGHRLRRVGVGRLSPRRRPAARSAHDECDGGGQGGRAAAVRSASRGIAVAVCVVVRTGCAARGGSGWRAVDRAARGRRHARVSTLAV